MLNQLVNRTILPQLAFPLVVLGASDNPFDHFNLMSIHSGRLDNTEPVPFSPTPFVQTSPGLPCIMKEAIVSPGPEVKIVDSPIPANITPDQVVIKVVVSGSNPKDWKYSDYTNKSFNSGDDIAGVIHAVGSNVVEFHPGDRVAAFHQMRAPHGSFAEYAVSLAHTTFHIPKKTTFEGRLPQRSSEPSRGIPD